MMVARVGAAIIALLCGKTLDAQITGQDTTPKAPSDTVRPAPIDTMRQPSRDTTVAILKPIRKDTTQIRADTVQARIGRDHAMLSLEIGQAYTFTREEYFSSGALMLTDVLARIPGVTTFQTNWMHSVQMVAYNGDLGRLRVFYDGIELDELNTRQNGIVDLSEIPAWSLNTMTITRGANELRIDIRSWEYNKVRPFTQFDVLTGDVQTSIYRAFYAKRYYNGTGMQIAGERFNDADLRFRTSGDRTTLLGRYGIARERWSLDATLLRTNNTRTIAPRFAIAGMSMAPYRGSNSLLYFRGAIGKEGDGPFAQVVAASRRLKENSPQFNQSTAGAFGFPADTADSTTSMAQYVATAGFDRWGGRVRLTDRYRVGNGKQFNAVSGSFELTKPLFSVNGMAESDPFVGFKRFEAGGRVQPVPFFAISGGIGQRTADSDRNDQPTSRSARIEAGVRLFNGPWVLAGVITRDTTLAIAPIVFDTAFRNVVTGRTTGTTFAVRGPLKYGFSIDGQATRWNDANGPYTPEYEVWGQLRFFTQWLRKFPKGDFSFLVAPRVEYRSSVAFPEAAGNLASVRSTVYGIQIQLRILRGVISFERRNLGGVLYEQIPGYVLPRAINVYGVRWYFFD